MTTVAKTGKWTDDEARKVIDRYNELGRTPEAVEKIAKEVGRTTRSIQSKLTSEEVYVVPNKPASKKRDEGPSKKDMLKEMSDCGFDVSGFEPASKPALGRLLDLVKQAYADTAAE